MPTAERWTALQGGLSRSAGRGRVSSGEQPGALARAVGSSPAGYQGPLQGRGTPIRRAVARLPGGSRVLPAELWVALRRAGDSHGWSCRGPPRELSTPMAGAEDSPWGSCLRLAGPRVRGPCPRAWTRSLLPFAPPLTSAAALDCASPPSTHDDLPGFPCGRARDGRGLAGDALPDSRDCSAHLRARSRGRSRSRSFRSSRSRLPALGSRKFPLRAKGRQLAVPPVRPGHSFELLTTGEAAFARLIELVQRPSARSI